MATFAKEGGEVRVVRPPGEARKLERQVLPSALFGEGDGVTDPAALSPRAAARIATVFACVRLLTHAVVPLPLKTYRERDGVRVEDRDGQLARLLARPAPGVTTPGLIGQMMTSLLLQGDCFLGVYLDGSGQPSQLSVLPPDQVEIRMRSGRVEYLYMAPDGVTELDQRDVIHVRAPMSLPGSLRGMSPVRWLAASLGEAQALGRSSVEFAKRAPRPGLLVTMDPNVSVDQMKRDGLRDEIEARYGDRAGSVMILGGGVTGVTPLTLDSASAEFLRHREVAAGEIARAYGCPAALLDLPGASSLTYSNAESRSADVLRYAAEAWLVSVERAVSAHPVARGVVARFDRRALLRPDTATRSEVYARALDPETGWMNRAEVRELEDLAPEAPAREPEVGV